MLNLQRAQQDRFHQIRIGRDYRHITTGLVLVLFGLCTACGGGGGAAADGGGDSDSCANSKNIDGEWWYDMLITDASGSFCAFAPGDEITDFGTILQTDTDITYYSGSAVYTGGVCGKDMDLYAGWTPAGSFYAYEEWIVGEISPDESLMTGYGNLNTYDSGTGNLVCEVAYTWYAYKGTFVGGGDGQNGATVFNYDDEAKALVFARSTDSSRPRTQILGAVPPREYGDFTLPPGFWDLYMTYPGEHSRHFELAR